VVIDKMIERNANPDIAALAESAVQLDRYGLTQYAVDRTGQRTKIGYQNIINENGEFSLRLFTGF